MKTTQHLDQTTTSGSEASAIKAEEYDLLILGSGAAGKLLSWTLAKKGDEDGSDRAKVCGRFLPEHRLSSEQEHHPQRKGRIVLQAERGVRNRKG